jgi:tripartite-type tricarboxylate transporter receptor subunit TctC
MMNRRLAILVGAALAAPRMDAFGAEDCCPGKCCPSSFVVPFPPGGPADVQARLLARALSERWGSTVTVDNVPGSGGLVGALRVMNSTGDGKTFLFSNESVSTNAALDVQRAREALDGLKPVAQVSSTPYVLVVRAQAPYRTLSDFISAARRDPGKLLIASNGRGSSSHIVGEIFSDAASVRLSHVPYKGTAPAVTDLVAGQVSAAILDVPSALGLLREGKLRALAVTSPSENPALSGVQTFAQAGIPRMDVSSWAGLFAPTSLSDATTRRVAMDVAAAVQQSATKDAFASIGAQPSVLDAAAFRTKIRADFQARSAIVSSKHINRE